MRSLDADKAEIVGPDKKDFSPPEREKNRKNLPLAGSVNSNTGLLLYEISKGKKPAKRAENAFPTPYS